MKKTPAVGTASFPAMMRENRYYVDKTDVIKPLMESGKYVQLITRPRRFGKTLFRDTLKTFLEIDAAHPGETSWQKKLFSGLKIRKETAFCEAFMGQFPVLFISLRKVKGRSFSAAMEALIETVERIAKGVAGLLESPRLTEDDKNYLRHCMAATYFAEGGHQKELKFFLSRMTTMLAQHYGRQTVLLIDEYDVPLQKAVKAGYYADMLEFMQAFLSCLKEEEGVSVNGLPVIRKAVITGCLRVSKASIFTDVNNFSVNTVCMQGGFLATAIGFTTNEVSELLAYYGLEDKRETVQAWYDGYRFGSSEIYCPWDVIHYCADILEEHIDQKTFEPQNYWAETSSNDVIDEFLGFLSDDDTDKMQTLLDGGVIKFRLNEQITYDDFSQHKSEDFWTLLLFTGYLTVVRQRDGVVYVRIPNEEIRKTFAARVMARFSEMNGEFVAYGRDFAKAASEGDADTMATILVRLLENYVSVRDTATKAPAENYYHGFLTALLSCAGAYARDMYSNREAGDGYADLLFTSGTGSQRVGVVLELKRCAVPEEMYDAAEAALKQIRDKRYTARLDRLRCGKQCVYGIAFCRKDCAVCGGVLTQ